jgi:hypothetical protein
LALEVENLRKSCQDSQAWGEKAKAEPLKSLIEVRRMLGGSVLQVQQETLMYLDGLAKVIDQRFVEYAERFEEIEGELEEIGGDDSAALELLERALPLLKAVQASSEALAALGEDQTKALFELIDEGAVFLGEEAQGDSDETTEADGGSGEPAQDSADGDGA